MKSPWKFLARLTGRRASDAQGPARQLDRDAYDAAENEVSSQEPDQDPAVRRKDVDQETKSRSDETADPVEAGAIVHLPASGKETSEATEEIQSETVKPSIDEVTIAAAPNTSAKSTKRAKNEERKSRTVERAVEAEQQVVPSSDFDPREQSSEHEPMDTVRKLDREIQELRRQLSRKLVLQNAQLREMLARFETR
jgi:hypothetical protein